MAEVVWQARRVSDGVLVDVTGDTAGTPMGAPTPNPLEGGGGGAIAVTDGTTTVDPALELLVGTVTDEGGGVAGLTTFPGGWAFDTGNSDFLHNDGAGVLIGDLTENDPYSKLEAGQVYVRGNGALLTLIDATSGMSFLDVGAPEGTRMIDALGEIQIQATAAGAVMMPTLPTADPTVAGQLWNDTGTLKVSAG